jgi:hypothetical protein
MTTDNGFTCPITKNIMNDPWGDKYGHTYEKEKIFEWVNLTGKSPMNKQPLTVKDLYPNLNLKRAIDVYLGLSFKEPATANPVNPASANKRKPFIGILMADVSESMGAICSNQNSSEKMYYTPLDLVKHTLRTIIESLTEEDYVALIKFNTVGVPLTGIIQATQINKTLLLEKIEDLHADGGTNIWDPLRIGIEMSSSFAKQNNEATINMLLFTDGVSNIDPPQGILETYKKHILNEPELKISLNTYGFGYNINSSLLFDLSEFSKGIFGFIPDSTMIGTVFINSVSHLLTKYDTNIELSPQEDEVCQKLVTFLKGSHLKEFVEYADQFRGNQLIDDILFDCTESTNENDGQIEKAFNPKYYRVWGRHYIFSVISAYANKFCLNFKDKGIQHFKHPQFNIQQQIIEDIFIKMPPPVPTGRSQFNTHAAVNSQQFKMSFYNPHGGCFLERTQIKIKDGGFICVEDLRKGMIVEALGIQAEVICVVKLKFSGYIRKLNHETALTGLTPYHPIFFKNYEWEFPELNDDDFFNIDVKNTYVYDLVLSTHHVVELEGGVFATTFGHGRTGPVIEHEYFGSDQIINDLKKHYGWEDGFIQLDNYVFQRDPSTHLIVKLTF